MTINNFYFQVVSHAESKDSGQLAPVLAVPMMSDEKWMELTNTPEQIKRREQLRKAGVLRG